MQKWEYLSLGRKYYGDENLKRNKLQEKLKFRREDKMLDIRIYGLEKGWYWEDIINLCIKEATQNTFADDYEWAAFLDALKARNEIGVDDRLNALGREGWELVSFAPLTQSAGDSISTYTSVTQYEYYFKRPLKEETE